MPFKERFDDAKRRRIIDRIKLHVETNKELYIVGASCLYAGYTFGNHRSTHIVNSPIISPVISPVFNNDNSSIVNFGGHMTKIVKCLETGEVWEKVTEAADAVNAPVSVMSKHLNGHKDHLDGLHYQIIGVSTAG